MDMKAKIKNKKGIYLHRKNIQIKSKYMSFH